MGIISGNGLSQDDLVNFLENVRDMANQLRTDRITQAFFSGGLTAGATATGQVRIANTGAYMIDGTAYLLSGATEVAFAATTDDLAVSQQAYYLISLNTSGAAVITKGTAVAASSTATVPALPASQCPVGHVLIATSANTIFNAVTDELDATSTWLTITFTNRPLMLGSLPAALTLSL